jgi:hypothetical protein
VEQVYSRLRNPEFESSSIVGERRIGKTSLLNFIAHLSVIKSRGLDPRQYMFICVDLQMVNQTMNPSRFWQRALKEVEDKIDHARLKTMLDEARKRETIDNYVLTDVFDVVDEQGVRIVLLLDEFEKVTANPNFGASFFGGLRALAIHHNLALVTASRKELVELCHSEAVRSSPFFNIFANINLRALIEDEVNELLSKSLQDTGISFNEEERSFIFHIAGYHPYFLQVACHFLFEAHTRGMDDDTRRAFMLKEFREEVAPHLAYYWHHSDDGEKIVLTALALLERQGKTRERAFSVDTLRKLYSRSELTLIELEKRGLLTQRDDTFTLFSTVFGGWIVGELTDRMREAVSYEDWVASHEGLFTRLSERVRDEASDILPEIGAKYRELVVNWLADPRTWTGAVGLLRGVLGT